MSNKKVETATTPGYFGPLYPKQLNFIQDSFQTRRYNRRPVSDEFIQFFARELELIFRGVRHNLEFVTDDGLSWRSVSFLHGKDVRFKIAFPRADDRRHQDGTVSSQHVALYYENDQELPEETVGQMAQAICQLFDMDLQTFYR